MNPPTLYGREQPLTMLCALLDAGEVVLVYGPIGVGKSALLRAVERSMRQRGRACGFATCTRSLADFTATLGRAYPAVSRGSTMRAWRGRLRLAAERVPGVLLLDDLGDTGAAFKGAIKSVRGIGVGIALAADVDQPRERERVRALGLTHRELELAPLHGSSMRAVLQSLLQTRALPFTLGPDEFRALVAATDGLPGRAVDFANALVDPNSWSGGRPRVEWLRTGSVIRAAERYRRPLPGDVLPTGDALARRGNTP